MVWEARGANHGMTDHYSPGFVIVQQMLGYSLFVLYETFKDSECANGIGIAKGTLEHCKTFAEMLNASRGIS